MQRFDCLSLSAPVVGPHLLEASAGTGKTFAIEHVFSRLLLLEDPIPLEAILVVTFTKAAARELKTRIQNHLLQLLSILKEESKSSWEYVTPWIGSKKAILTLTQALKNFDAAQIFTIHGFCFRMLKEFPFESGVFSVAEENASIAIAQKKRNAFSLFLHCGVEENFLCPEQLALLMQEYPTVSELQNAVFRQQDGSPRTYEELARAFAKVLNTWQKPFPTKEELVAEFYALSRDYKAKDGDFLTEIACFHASFLDPSLWKGCILQGGALFSLFDPKNKKLRAKDAMGFLPWAAEHIGPLVLEAVNKKNILSLLSMSWRKWEKKWMEEVGIFSPDAILQAMLESVRKPLFLQKLQARYAAVIIDEFQDTDPVQWEIFQSAFVSHCKAVYLVGDPKQSIYRFRKADVYTYLAAKEFLGSKHCYRLDTNFRSSPSLIAGLNALFSRNFLFLPKKQEYLPCLPVKAGLKEEGLSDDKKAIHWMIGGEKAKIEDPFLPFIAEEITKFPGQSIAILVKDRFEAQKALDLLRKKNIPATAKSHQTLAETKEFCAIKEVLQWLSFPEDPNLLALVKMGPFGNFRKPAAYWRSILEEQGLVPFFSEFFFGKKFSFPQIVEELFAWEQREGFSFLGLQKILTTLERFHAEEGTRLFIEEEKTEVQILTLHVSKGLEFDIVFALALFSSTDARDAEEEAEKLRLLYVAMTRAKKRLYIPAKETVGAQPSSPIDLFLKPVGDIFSFLQTSEAKDSFSFERLLSPYPLTLALPQEEPQQEPQAAAEVFSIPSLYIQSFTSLAEKKEIHPVSSILGEIPRGAETGTVIHAILESIFRSHAKVWKDRAKLEEWVEQAVKNTHLAAWSQEIQAMIVHALCQDLWDGEKHFSLQEVDEVFVEMEFFYENLSEYVKGFVDLVFIHQGKWYFLDWKTNALKDSSKESVEEAMRDFDYALQASLYTEALRRHLVDFDEVFVCAFYLFLRMHTYIRVRS